MILLLLMQAFADLILLNGKIWTVNPAQPRVQAVACLNGRIAATGTDEEIRPWAGPATRVIDLGGKLAVPGFNDAHVHFATGGARLSGVQLRAARTPEEFRDRIGAFAAKHPKGAWVTGGDWNHENWPGGPLPTRQLIDPVTADHPVFVNRLDGHMGLANSLALKRAGITRATPDPPGGAIMRDANGEPTGILKDSAMDPVERVIPEPSSRQIEDSVRAAMKYAAAQGVTSVHDMSASPEILRVYQKLMEVGELTVRIYGLQPLPSWQQLARIGVGAGLGNDKLKIGALKGFSDGSLGSTTALFFEPYNDAPQSHGLPADQMIPEEKMLNNILGADRAGLHVAVHAIGDKANERVLSFFAEARKRNGGRDRRFRIEHAQHLRAREIPQFAELGVIASMQPYHCIDDGVWAEKRIGAKRAAGAYAFRSLIDSGAVLAFGSDWFVAPMEPLMGIYAAVTRRTLDGKRLEGWIPEQKITAAEAIRAYTMGSAYASFDEKTKGSIEPGKLADIAVLSDDILTVDPVRIREARVVMTIFDGSVIYETP
jgi:predicted amidohydrolase YtcJ